MAVSSPRSTIECIQLSPRERTKLISIFRISRDILQLQRLVRKFGFDRAGFTIYPGGVLKLRQNSGGYSDP